MKAYQIKIELCKSNPLVWRRFIIPSNATFRKLHNVIQGVTNFVSVKYDYHLYEFDLINENTSISNDKEAYLTHQDFIRNPKKYLNKNVSESNKFQKMYIERISKKVKQPGRVKIAGYLEKNRFIKYFYDFGDSWEFNVILEEIIDEYEYPYSTLLDGEHDAPPEDVGGISGFSEFLDVVSNPSHPERQGYLEWAESLGFQRFNVDAINERIKDIDI